MHPAPPTPAPARALVVQLARFGDLLQTRRLVKSLQAAGSEVHLAVDQSLARLAELAFPGAVAHGLPAHRAGSLSAPEFLAAARPVLADLAGAGFGQVYNLNFAGMNFALSTLFDPAAVRGYRLEQGQPRMDPWNKLVFRWTRHRRFAGLNVMDLWGHLADAPLPPGEVNPVARPRGGGLGVVLAGRHSRRSLPPAVLAPLVAAVADTWSARRVALLAPPRKSPWPGSCWPPFPRPWPASPKTWPAAPAWPSCSRRWAAWTWP